MVMANNLLFRFSDSFPTRANTHTHTHTHRQLHYCMGFPSGAVGMESACQCRVLSLGQEDPLEEEMVPHSNIPAWKTL